MELITNDTMGFLDNFNKLCQLWCNIIRISEKHIILTFKYQ
jgi:hypothetical protein